MRHLLLASALLAAASLTRADDGVVPSVAYDDAPSLNAPLEGPAFIDPVFPNKGDVAVEDRELEAYLDYIPAKEDIPMPDEGSRVAWKTSPDEILLDAVASFPADESKDP
jgi:hypothetical protein